MSLGTSGKVFLVTASLLVTGCGPLGKQQSDQASSFSFSEETAFCSGPIIYSDSIRVTTRAQYLARQISDFGLGDPGPAQSIRYAEVNILNSAGTLVQCGLTDGDGNIVANIPKVLGTYRLSVNSRSNSSFYKASILNNPTTNQPYHVDASFTANSLDSQIVVQPLIANFEGDLVGGAFNILDQIFKVNDFLRKNSACPTQGNICHQFDVAPPVRVYWTPGITPFSYYGRPQSPMSFFTKKDDPSAGIRAGLYIQGGLLGDVDCSDTDHFDNSVIIHEYGHFLEYAFAKTSSPGGAHNGNFIIDPRLAWSEGWANFIQTAVLGDSNYRDSIGNTNCGGSSFLGVALDLNRPQYGQDLMYPGTPSGEGVFREVSVSRELYHQMSSVAAGGAAGIGFPYIWKIFSDNIGGFSDPSVRFLNIGKFNEIMKNLVAVNDPSKSLALQSTIDSEHQLADQGQYALPIKSKAGNNCEFTITGVPDIYSMGKYRSDLMSSNDFFVLNYYGTDSEIQLHYVSLNSNLPPSDLDLDIYTENYIYDDPTTMVARSHNSYPERSSIGFESASLAGRPAGNYLINVRVNTSQIQNAAKYYITNAAGVRLCPW
jgi:hypothetical protein